VNTIEELKKELAEKQEYILQLEKYIKLFKKADTLSWTDRLGCKHIVTVEYATEVLHQFFDDWPGGFEEIEAELNYWKKQAGKLEDE